MACEVAYPVEFPTDCIVALAGIVRRGETMARKAEVAKHSWTILGYGFRQAFGDPDHPPVIGAADGKLYELADVSLSTDNDAEIADQLEEIVAGAVGTDGHGPVAAASIPWLLLVAIAEILIRRLLREGK